MRIMHIFRNLKILSYIFSKPIDISSELVCNKSDEVMMFRKHFVVQKAKYPLIL
jgi:hypothetical protein